MGFLCVCVRRRTPECVHRCKATPCVRAPFVCDDGTRLLFVLLFSSEHSRLGNSFFFSVSLSSACGARCGRCVKDTFFFLLPPSRVFSLPLLPHSTSLTYYCPCSGTCLLELVVPSLTSAPILLLFFFFSSLF